MSTLKVDTITSADGTASPEFANGLSASGTITINGSGSKLLNGSVSDGSITVSGGEGISGGQTSGGFVARGSADSYNAGGVEVYTGGAERFVINSTGNATFSGNLTVSGDFYVSGDSYIVDEITVTGDITSGGLTVDTDTLHVDSLNNRVGINTLTPTSDLDVAGTASALSLIAATADINAGTIDGTVIGGSSAAAGSFTTISASGEIAANGGVAFGDNDKAVFGAGSDLQIYHDGSNSFVTNSFGDLAIQASTGRISLAKSPFEFMVEANIDADVSLYYDSAKKLATTATGIDVTGTVTADGLTVDVGSGGVTFNGISDIVSIVQSFAGSPAYIHLDNTIEPGGKLWRVGSTGGVAGVGKNFGILNQTDNTNIVNFASNGDISFYEDTGTTAKFFWDASAESLGIGTTTPIKPLTLASADTATISGIALNHGASNYWGVGSYTDQSFRIAKSHGLEDVNTYFTIARSTGNVGIGTSSPASFGVLTAARANPQIVMEDTAAGTNGKYTAIGTSNGNMTFNRYLDNGTLVAQYMTLDAGGNLLVGTTSDAVGTPGVKALSWGRLIATTNGGAGAPFIGYHATAVTSDTIMELYSNVYGTTSLPFYIRANGGIGNYQANNVNLSDEREKKDIEELDSTWDCVGHWDLVKFRYNEDDTETPQKYGVIAQQVQQHCPEVIESWKKDEETERLAVKEQQMYWMAIKALQEAMTRIETLEAEVAALKGA